MSPKRHAPVRPGSRWWRMPRTFPAGAVPATLPPGLFVLTDDGVGLAEALARRIVAAGGTVRIVDAGADVSSISSEPGAQPVGFVHLAPYGAKPLAPGDGAPAWRDQVQRHEALPAPDAAPLRRQPYGRRKGAHSIEPGRAVRARRDGARGASRCRAAGRASSNACARNGRAPSPRPSTSTRLCPSRIMPRACSRSWRSPAGASRSAIRADAAPSSAPSRRSSNQTCRSATPCPKGAVVLATGGARGITAETLRPLARQGVTLVLAGRTALPGSEDPRFAGIEAGALRAELIKAARAAGEQPKPAEIERKLQALLRDREIRANLADFDAAGASGRLSHRRRRRPGSGGGPCRRHLSRNSAGSTASCTAPACSKTSSSSTRTRRAGRASSRRRRSAPSRWRAPCSRSSSASSSCSAPSRGATAIPARATTPPPTS